MIELCDVTKKFGGALVLDRFSAAFPDGRVICLFAPSGSGKTTLLRLVAGLIPPDGGEIAGVEGRRTAVVFQEDRLLPWRTAAENVALVYGRAAGAESVRRAGGLLGELGLSDAAGKYPGEMSGGMCRRVALARAAAYGGDLLLLDEPFKGLDEPAKAVAMDFLRRHFPKATVLYVTHDMQEARQFADELLLFSGPPLRKI